jgi:hypothetical protein
MTGINIAKARSNRLLLSGLGLLVLLAVVGIWRRGATAERLTAETQDAAIAVVSVAMPRQEPSV